MDVLTSPHEETLEFGIPMWADHPEDCELLDIDLPGFCPAVYPWKSLHGLPLSDQAPARQAGTLDAH